LYTYKGTMPANNAINNIRLDTVAIAHGAFRDCTNLTSVTIPDSVTSIGASAFYGCKGLTSITVDAQNGAFSSIEGILFNKNRTVLVTYPAGKQGGYTIPNGVTTIEGGAFSDCINLTSIIIPNSVTTIGDYTFYGCSILTSISIPTSVTSIGECAFGVCPLVPEVRTDIIKRFGEGPFESADYSTLIE